MAEYIAAIFLAVVKSYNTEHLRHALCVGELLCNRQQFAWHQQSGFLFSYEGRLLIFLETNRPLLMQTDYANSR